MKPIRAIVDDVENTDLGYLVKVLLPTTQTLSTFINQKVQIGDVVWVTIDFERRCINQLWFPEDLVEKVPEPKDEELSKLFMPSDIIDLADDQSEEE